ncbi:Hypothetical_protein [Hexamita inflata]|uniref:Hypothetical_protein n=1 Tax=Hexamita inflata TaxID=28002 RepID=A0AA86UHS7_9EUKA|nr:Hypothetical protein HINF_LOCUS43904 [Hexamita inflata]
MHKKYPSMLSNFPKASNRPTSFLQDSPSQLRRPSTKSNVEPLFSMSCSQQESSYVYYDTQEPLVKPAPAMMQERQFCTVNEEFLFIDRLTIYKLIAQINKSRFQLQSLAKDAGKLDHKLQKIFLRLEQIQEFQKKVKQTK